MGGVLGKRPHQGEGLDPGAMGVAAQGVEGAAPERHGIRHEEHVEKPAFRKPGKFDEMGEVTAAVGNAIRMPPGGDVVTAGPVEHPEFHTTNPSPVSFVPLVEVCQTSSYKEHHA